MIREQMLDDANTDKLEILNGNDYPVKSGMLRAEAQLLRRTLAGLVHLLEDCDMPFGLEYTVKSAKVDLELTEYLAINPERTEYDRAPADRELGGGYSKDGNTGEIIDTGCPDDNVNDRSKF